MSLVPIKIQERNVEILNRAFAARRSMDVDEVKTLLGWSPQDGWGVNSLNEAGDSILSLLGQRSTTEVDGDLTKWVDLMFHTMDHRGGLPNALVWAKTLTEMYQRRSLDDFPDISNQIQRWFEIAPDEYWQAEGENIIKVAFEKKHWDQVDNILSKGVSPDTLIDTKIMNYGSISKLPLLVSATDEKIANILVKHNANPLLDIQGKTSIDYLEERSEGFYSSATVRRDVLKIVRASAEEILAAESPEKALLKKVKTMWNVVEDRPSWMDIQTAANALGKDLKDTRGKFGENLLHWVVFKAPHFVPNLMRMKLSNKDWIKQKDDLGLTVFDYWQMSGVNNIYLDREQKAKFIKGFEPIALELAPSTKEEAWESHERIWSWQAKNLLDAKNSNDFASSAKRVHVKWFFKDDDDEILKGVFPESSDYDKSMRAFKKSLATAKGFNRAVPFFNEIALHVGVLNIPHTESYKGRYNSYGLIDSDPSFGEFLSNGEAEKLSQESKDFILRVYTNDLYNLSHSGYMVLNGADDRKKVLSEMNQWVSKSASLSGLISEIESDKTAFAKVFNHRLADSESFKNIWQTEIKPGLERAELTRRASGQIKQPKNNTPDLFAL